MTPKTQGTAATPDAPVQPAAGSYRHILDQDVAITMLMQLQSSVAEVKTALAGVKGSVDQVTDKVDHLIQWKNRIIGGAIVLGVVATLLGFMIEHFSSYITITTPSSHSAQGVEQPADRH